MSQTKALVARKAGVPQLSEADNTLYAKTCKRRGGYKGQTKVPITAALIYDAVSGNFAWNIKAGVRFNIGTIAGYVTGRGYRAIKYNGKTYAAHRLAWLYYYGRWPKYEIDHMNGNKLDNRIANLRDVPHIENTHNRVEHRNGKLIGIYFNKAARLWHARISVKGRVVSLGYYKTADTAYEAYRKAAKEVGYGDV